MYPVFSAVTLLFTDVDQMKSTSNYIIFTRLADITRLASMRRNTHVTEMYKRFPYAYDAAGHSYTLVNSF